MSDRSRIEWTEATWNPIVGCTKVSPGCKNCYAIRMARRLDGLGRGYDGTTAPGPNWSGQVNLLPERLEDPLRWRRPRRVFVNSMSDLFHEQVPIDFIAHVFAIMASATVECGKNHRHTDECWSGPRHTFQILTKRPERMRQVVEELPNFVAERLPGDSPLSLALELGEWPLPNVWLGVSVEDQRRADERIPHLVATPAAVRFLSCEPLLGPVDLSPWLCPGCPDEVPFHVCGRDNLHWVIVGGETGPGARPMHPDWARSLRDQCIQAGVPFFFKQWGEWSCSTTRPDKAPGFVAPDGTWQPYQPVGYGREYPGRVSIWRVGKKAAGRLLDGRTWDEMPGRQAVPA